MTHADLLRDCIVYQTDPRLPWGMRTFGCRARALMAIPEFVTGHCLTPEQINFIVDWALTMPNVLKNEPGAVMLTGRDEHMLINTAFTEVGSRRHGRQVGWLPAHEETREWTYMIGQWETKRENGQPGIGHYTLFDRRKKEIFDPHKPIQAGYEINKVRLVRMLFYDTWLRVSA